MYPIGRIAQSKSNLPSLRPVGSCTIQEAINKLPSVILHAQIVCLVSNNKFLVALTLACDEYHTPSTQAQTGFYVYE